jgi:DNA-binding transcriptional LysR family regulator
MDFDQLETFLEVARHVSFSRAAEKRFRTQPAISSQIRAIEDEVGAKLFDRSGGKVSLTTAGKAFQKYAEPALDARKAMLVDLAEMERIPRGEIIVGANEGTCLHILPEVFSGFKKLYPSVSVNSKRSDLDSSELLKRFVAADVGIGFISSSNMKEDVRAQGLVVVPIAEVQMRRDLALVFRNDKALSRAASAFIAIAVKHNSTQELVTGTK